MRWLFSTSAYHPDFMVYIVEAKPTTINDLVAKVQKLVLAMAWEKVGELFPTSDECSTTI